MTTDDEPDPWPDDEPFTFTAEEIEDIRQNGLNLSDVIASTLAESEPMPDEPDQPYVVDAPPPPEDRP